MTNTKKKQNVHYQIMEQYEIKKSKFTFIYNRRVCIILQVHSLFLDREEQNLNTRSFRKEILSVNNKIYIRIRFNSV
jgi:hypothetical protein